MLNIQDCANLMFKFQGVDLHGLFLFLRENYMGYYENKDNHKNYKGVIIMLKLLLVMAFIIAGVWFVECVD